MRRPSVLRIVGCLVGIALLLCGFVTPGFLKSSAVFEGAREKWWRSDVPQYVEFYEWSSWNKGPGSLGVPPLEELRNATITSHRFGHRQTFWKDYTFCQAQYLLKDGSAKIWYALCPGPHVVWREYRVELGSGIFLLLGSVLLGLCIFWPNRRIQPTQSGAADPER